MSSTLLDFIHELLTGKTYQIRCTGLVNSGQDFVWGDAELLETGILESWQFGHVHQIEMILIGPVVVEGLFTFDVI